MVAVALGLISQAPPSQPLMHAQKVVELPPQLQIPRLRQAGAHRFCTAQVGLQFSQSVSQFPQLVSLIFPYPRYPVPAHSQVSLAIQTPLFKHLAAPLQICSEKFPKSVLCPPITNVRFAGPVVRFPASNVQIMAVWFIALAAPTPQTTD